MPAIPMPREVDDVLDAHREALAREEPFREGRAAGLGGIAFALNPYSDGIGRADWARGWYEGNSERAAQQAKRHAIAMELRQRAAEKVA